MIPLAQTNSTRLKITQVRSTIGGKQNQRAFPQVIGAGLEGESYHADAAFAACKHLGDRVVYVCAI